MNTKIWLSPPHISGEELKYIQQAFESNWIAPLGPNIDEFENAIQSYIGEHKQVAVLNSGTAAIHLALVLLGITRGDEVLCQSFTFSASVNPIVYLGATPIFIDSESKTWNICPEQLEIAILDRIKNGKKPKAIIAVHLYGMPYNVSKIKELGQKYAIPIIEDSAEALGSKVNDQKCGSFGDYAILSFNGNKVITTSGGGALITDSVDLKDKTIFLATQAKDKAPHFQHSRIGYNYRMSNILAGIGRGQMEVLQDRVVARRKNFDFYKEALKHLNFKFLEEPEGYYSNRWLTCLITESSEIREKIILAFNIHNIESRPFWKPMHQQPIFSKYPSYLNGVSEDLFEKGLCLPSGSNLSKIELQQIVSVIKKQV
jgi:dTDP-4-amino-4,6-dideoxygalactose transaminase